MDTLTRRRFLLTSGVVGAGALAAGAGAYSLRDLLDTTGDRDPQSRTLVLVTLYGGNDGLNTVIPYGDPAYRAARPELAYPDGEVRRLDDDFGLNPALAGLHQRWSGGGLAIVRGSATRSRTAATSGRWTSGTPRNRTGPATRAGSGGGWTEPVVTPGWRSPSSRRCRRCWPGPEAPAPLCR